MNPMRIYTNRDGETLYLAKYTVNKLGGVLISFREKQDLSHVFPIDCSDFAKVWLAVVQHHGVNNVVTEEFTDSGDWISTEFLMTLEDAKNVAT